jgi:arylsulfatase A-like enzyme
MIESMDDAIGTLLDALDRLQVADNTIIIFTSDNGFMLGEHRMAEKQWAYEPSIRVPMVFRLPWSLIGRNDSHLVMNIDLASTIATLAGVKPGLKQNGVSMTPLLLSEGAPVPWRDEIYLEFRATTPAPRRPPPYRGVRTAQWKYVEYDNGWRELYNLLTDPFELDNLAGDPVYAGVQAGLSAEVLALSKT